MADALPKLLLLLLLGVQSAFADDRAHFHGTWGTPAQCAREPILSGGTVRAEPFEIDTEWLRQGAHWCRLNWFPVQRRDGRIYTSAQAQCGEDSVRGYLLRLELVNDDLYLRWGLRVANGPLARCPAS